MINPGLINCLKLTDVFEKQIIITNIVIISKMMSFEDIDCFFGIIKMYKSNNRCKRDARCMPQSFQVFWGKHCKYNFQI